MELDFTFERFFLVCIVADYSCRIGCVSWIVAVTGARKFQDKSKLNCLNVTLRNSRSTLAAID